MLILLTKSQKCINTNVKESDEHDYQNTQKNNSIENDAFWAFHEHLVYKSRYISKNNDFTMADKLKYYLN